MASLEHDVLIIPAKPDVERDAVASEWAAQGGTVVRLDRFWVRPDVDPEKAALYGADTFCLVLAQLLGLDLVSPPDGLLLGAGRHLTKRAIHGVSLGEALGGPFPAFVKPWVPKQFRGAVWCTAEDLQAECKGLPSETPVLVSEVVPIAAEARAWLLAGKVVTCAVYEGTGDSGEASTFIEQAAASLELPEVCVLDAALVQDGWCVLEANAAWGAGLNGCDASAVVSCIDRATRSGR